MSKAKVCIRRKWGNHPIEVLAFLDDTEVGVKVQLTDFLDALVEEMGNPSMVMTKAALKDKLRKALPAVEEEFKKATLEVV